LKFKPMVADQTPAGRKQQWRRYPPKVFQSSDNFIRVIGRGTARAEDAQGTPTQSHISPSILLYADKVIRETGTVIPELLLLQQALPPEIEQRYRGTSLIRNRPPLGPYSRTMPRLLWRS